MQFKGLFHNTLLLWTELKQITFIILAERLYGFFQEVFMLHVDAACL